MCKSIVQDLIPFFFRGSIRRVVALGFCLFASRTALAMEGSSSGVHDERVKVSTMLFYPERYSDATEMNAFVHPQGGDRFFMTDVLVPVSSDVLLDKIPPDRPNGHLAVALKLPQAKDEIEAFLNNDAYYSTVSKGGYTKEGYFKVSFRNKDFVKYNQERDGVLTVLRVMPQVAVDYSSQGHKVVVALWHPLDPDIPQEESGD